MEYLVLDLHDPFYSLEQKCGIAGLYVSLKKYMSLKTKEIDLSECKFELHDTKIVISYDDFEQFREWTIKVVCFAFNFKYKEYAVFKDKDKNDGDSQKKKRTYTAFVPKDENGLNYFAANSSISINEKVLLHGILRNIFWANASSAVYKKEMTNIVNTIEDKESVLKFSQCLGIKCLYSYIMKMSEKNNTVSSSLMPNCGDKYISSALHYQDIYKLDLKYFYPCLFIPIGSLYFMFVDFSPIIVYAKFDSLEKFSKTYFTIWDKQKIDRINSFDEAWIKIALIQKINEKYNVYKFKYMHLTKNGKAYSVKDVNSINILYDKLEQIEKYQNNLKLGDKCFNNDIGNAVNYFISKLINNVIHDKSWLEDIIPLGMGKDVTGSFLNYIHLRKEGVINMINENVMDQKMKDAVHETIRCFNGLTMAKFPDKKQAERKMKAERENWFRMFSNIYTYREFVDAALKFLASSLHNTVLKNNQDLMPYILDEKRWKENKSIIFLSIMTYRGNNQEQDETVDTNNVEDTIGEVEKANA